MRALEPIQRERIPAYREKWLRIANSVERIDAARAKAAILELYAELNLGTPEILAVASPAEAFRTRVRWKGRTGRHAHFLWDYQLPLCDPQGYWRRCGPEGEEIHFASKRKRNALGCYAYLDENSPKPTLVLDPKLHAELWQEFDVPELDWCERMIDFFALEMDELDTISDEDPTCQACDSQFMLLGPFDWLCQEVACVDFCHAELGIPRNERLYDSLEQLLRFGSLTLTFEKLCILCDRPVEIGPRLKFSDRSIVE